MIVAVMPFIVTVADTPFNMMLVVLMVVASMASENVTLIAPFTATLVALFAGLVLETVGAMVSGATPVVNDQT